ncbi:MAG: hypothetical protein HKM24_06325 [Gammaproteobacteria bacterium]|nr:hypothetical protein [Gammaproteobacteria bacterium]
MDALLTELYKLVMGLFGIASVALFFAFIAGVFYRLIVFPTILKRHEVAAEARKDIALEGKLLHEGDAMSRRADREDREFERQQRLDDERRVNEARQRELDAAAQARADDLHRLELGMRDRAAAREERREDREAETHRLEIEARRRREDREDEKVNHQSQTAADKAAAERDAQSHKDQLRVLELEAARDKAAEARDHRELKVAEVRKAQADADAADEAVATAEAEREAAEAVRAKSEAERDEARARRNAAREEARTARTRREQADIDLARVKGELQRATEDLDERRQLAANLEMIEAVANVPSRAPDRAVEKDESNEFSR